MSLANFYQQHLRDMGIISMPLTALTRKNKNGLASNISMEWQVWGIISKNQEYVVSVTLLVPPDLDKEFLLLIDACEDGFGAILEQIGAVDLWHPVAKLQMMLRRSILLPN